jgi:hypothetical protein
MNFRPLLHTLYRIAFHARLIFIPVGKITWFTLCHCVLCIRLFLYFHSNNELKTFLPEVLAHCTGRTGLVFTLGVSRHILDYFSYHQLTKLSDFCSGLQWRSVNNNPIQYKTDALRYNIVGDLVSQFIDLRYDLECFV